MSKIDEGGPAFPSNRDMRNSPDWDYEQGMSLRDYFAAHAPAEPQPWFLPKMPHRPESSYIGEDGTIYPSWRDAERACGDLWSNGSADEQDAWDREQAKQRFIQWPYAWADAMLDARERT